MLITAALFILTLMPVKPLKSKTFSLCFLSLTAALCLYRFVAMPSYEAALALDGREVEITGRVIEEKEVKNGKSYYIIETDSVSEPSAPQRLKIRLSAAAELDIEPFSKISATLYLNAPTDKYGLNSRNTYRSKGIYLFGRALDDIEITAPPQRVPYYYAIRLRTALREKINDYCVEDTALYLRAICLGESSALSNEAYQAMRNSGVIHIFVVSGLHLSIITGAFFFIFRKLRLTPRQSAVILMPIVMAFMLICGLSPSVLRAGIMNLIFLLARACFRRSDALNSLGFAVFLLLVINPFSVQSLSLLLSVLSTLGIITASDRLTLHHPPKHFARLLTNAYSLIVQTIAANLFTLPIMILVFGSIAVFAIPANLLISLPATLFLILGVIFFPLSFSGIEFIIKPLSFVLDIIRKYIEFVTSFLGGSDASLLRLDDKIYLLALGLSLILIGLTAVIFKKRRYIEYALLVSALVFSLSFVVQRVKVGENVTLKVLNVENGFAAVLYDDGGVNVIGCGGKGLSDLSLENELMSNRTVDLFMLVRNDTAFAGNAQTVINDLNVKNIMISSFGDCMNYDIIREKGANIISPNTDVTFGNTSVEFYDDERVSALRLRIKGSTLLVLSNRADLQGLPPEFAKADFVLCCKAPKNAQLLGNSVALISNSSKNGKAESLRFTDLGIPAIVTSDNGDITLTFKDGQIEVDSD